MLCPFKHHFPHISATSLQFTQKIYPTQKYTINDLTAFAHSVSKAFRLILAEL